MTHNIFVMRHIHRISDQQEDTTFISVYRSADAAPTAVARLRRQPGCCKHHNIIDPRVDEDVQGFCIDAYMLDHRRCCEGYVSL